MKILTKKQIGKETYHFEVEGKDLFEAVKELNRLSFQNINLCGICSKDNLGLKAKTVETKKGKFNYVYIKCYDCGAEVSFGRRIDDNDTYFIKKDENGKPKWYDPKKEAQGDETN